MGREGWCLHDGVTVPAARRAQLGLQRVLSGMIFRVDKPNLHFWPETHP